MYTVCELLHPYILKNEGLLKYIYKYRFSSYELGHTAHCSLIILIINNEINIKKIIQRPLDIVGVQKAVKEALHFIIQNLKPN